MNPNFFQKICALNQDAYWSGRVLYWTVSPSRQAGRQRVWVPYYMFLLASSYCNYAGAYMSLAVLVLHCAHAICSPAQCHTLCAVSVCTNHYGIMALLQQLNLFNHNLKMHRPVSPYHMYNFFFKVSQRDGWISLGGDLLRIPGRLHEFLLLFFIFFNFFFLQIHVTMIVHRPQEQLIFEVGWKMCRSGGHARWPEHLSWLYELANKRHV